MATEATETQSETQQTKTLVDSAPQLVENPDEFLQTFRTEVDALYKDLQKLNTKKNTAAGTRVRKRLMSWKKFADASRKKIQANVQSIREDRKSSRNAKKPETVKEEVKQEAVAKEAVAAPAPTPSKSKSKKKKKGKRK